MIETVGIVTARIYIALPCVTDATSLDTTTSLHHDAVVRMESDCPILSSTLRNGRLIDSTIDDIPRFTASDLRLGLRTTHRKQHDENREKCNGRANSYPHGGALLGK